MSAPLVTVAMTVYDGERFIGEAIESILAQNHRPIEVLVVDDGSTDTSADLAEAYGPPVRVIRCPHRGIGASRNTVFEAFTGDFILFADADDRVRPTAVADSLASLDADPTLDAVFHHTVEFVSPGIDPAGFADREPGKVRPGCMPAHCLVRREAVERVGAYDETLVRAEGAEWITRLLDLPAATTMLPDVLSERRLHDQNHGARHPGAIADYLTVARRKIHRQRERRAGNAPD